ncbi:hypothetical protein [Paenibacillus xylanexedens]|uniref:hypothetical protein n=1 Tax=Paenibacillus xylanexedens TaxID=528191 RepID=UPI0011A2DA86|nr:hypothetical protein [Paenibacillus xylanexedens]
MTNEMVKFTAEVAKGISVGTKDVTIKLLIPLAAVESRLSSLAKLQEKEVMVYLGDPQGSFNFDDEDQDPMYRTYDGGRRVTTDSSGVVTRIEGSEEEKDENQAQLFDAEGNPIQQQEPIGGDEETDTGDGQPTTDTPPGDEVHVTDQRDPYGDNDDNDIPDWMKQDGDDQSRSKEMEFGSSAPEGDQKPSDQDPPSGDAEVNSADVDPDELERYILANRPIIPDITLDVPAAIERKRGSDETWREIADSMGISQGKLSGAVSRYKKAVKEQMAGSGVA